MDLTAKEIENYIPWNEQEENDRKQLLRWMKSDCSLWDREEGFAHWTASAWVVNQKRDRVLMAYHNIYDSWSWLGGHCDGNHDCLAVAMKEVREESGVQNIKPLSTDIFSLEILTVDGHVKSGVYVPSHLHLNVTYLLEADENEHLKIRKGENSAVAWFELDEAIKASSEPWFQEHIYSKLNEKLRAFIQKENMRK